MQKDADDHARRRPKSALGLVDGPDCSTAQFQGSLSNVSTAAPTDLALSVAASMLSKADLESLAGRCRPRSATGVGGVAEMPSGKGVRVAAKQGVDTFGQEGSSAASSKWKNAASVDNPGPDNQALWISNLRRQEFGTVEYVMLEGSKMVPKRIGVDSSGRMSLGSLNPSRLPVTEARHHYPTRGPVRQ